MTLYLHICLRFAKIIAAVLRLSPIDAGNNFLVAVGSLLAHTILLANFCDPFVRWCSLSGDDIEGSFSYGRIA